MELFINEKIKILAKRKGVSISELARRLEKSPANLLQQLERNNFRVDDLKNIAAVLGYDVIIDFVEKPETDTRKK